MSKTTNRLQNFLKHILLGALLVPISAGLPSGNLPANGNGQKGNKSKEKEGVNITDQSSFKLIFKDLENSEFASYIVNKSGSQVELGIHVDGTRNMFLVPSQTNAAIESLFRKGSPLLNILRIFQPNLSETESENYLENFSILVGQDIDNYLENIRKGSWGTTVMSINTEAKVHFDSLSLRSVLIEKDYPKAEELSQLVIEEFFQAHQYDSVVGNLYNNGYFSRVSAIRSPESMVKEISTGNLRAFLELFPQQKYLSDLGVHSNSYNFTVGQHSFPGTTNSKNAINQPYNLLSNFIAEDLGIPINPADFLDYHKIQLINDTFRNKYLSYYTDKGHSDLQIQIWNLVGMSRNNRNNPENSLDILPILDLPS